MLLVRLADDEADYRELGRLGRSTEINRVRWASRRHKRLCHGINSMFQIFFADREEITNYRDFCTHMDRRKFQDFALRVMDKGVYMSPLGCTSFPVEHRT